MSDRLARAKRIVVKIGSSLLVDGATGQLRRDWLTSVAEDVAALRQRGAEVILVSSGAIALGRRHLKLAPGPLRLEESQAAAAVGQIHLAEAYTAVMAPLGIAVAQILLTLDDTEERRRYLNARETLNTLLSLGALPVINENDTVATAEIRFGDNDRLAARVAVMTTADTLVLLSDVDGLYTGNPNADPNAAFLEEVPEITPEIEAMAGKPGSDMGSGGMVTKLLAGKIATAGGCNMAITSGKRAHPLRALSEGARATWFLAKAAPAAARKQWILGTLSPRGSITVDAGAEKALNDGKSLLPAGVSAVDGAFERGDTVTVKNAAGRELGRGLIAYSDADARRIAGRRTREIEGLLGYRGRDEMIHRDDLVLTAKKS